MSAMWRIVAGIAAVPIIMIAGKTFKRWLYPPEFDVRVSMEHDEVIAGRETRVGSVTVSLPAEYRDYPEEQTAIPQPSFTLCQRDDQEIPNGLRSEIVPSRERWSLTVAVYVRIEQAGEFSLYTRLPEGIRHRSTDQQPNMCIHETQVTLSVNAGPVANLRIIRHEPEWLEDTDIKVKSYPGQERDVTIKGADRFDNTVVLRPTDWYLAAQNAEVLEQSTHITDNDEALGFSYSFNEIGTYEVTFESIDDTHSSVNAPSFDVEVSAPWLDPRSCRVETYRDYPDEVFFTGEQRPLELQVTLRDCTGEPFDYNLVLRDLLTAEIDGIPSQRTVIEMGDQNDELFIAVLDINEPGVVSIDVLYNGYSLVYLDYRGDEELLDRKLTEDIVGLVPYEENDYLVHEETNRIRFTGIPRGSIIGPAYANIDNINRILEETGCRIESRDINTQVCLDTDNLTGEAREKAFRVFSKVVKSFHYRRRAEEFDKERQVWRDKATAAFVADDHERAQDCRAIKQEYGVLMNSSNRSASDAIFCFFNEARPESEIDLHGQRVGDEEQLQAYRQRLHQRNIPPEEIDAIIDEQREEMNEAIRKLNHRWTHFNHPQAQQEGRPWLEIIDGAGHHSRNEQRIRPKVEEFLRNQGHEFISSNQGALLVTFSEYTGGEPCFANFYCETCHKTWGSATSWKAMWQLCYGCDKDGIQSMCFPLKLRPEAPSRINRIERRGGFFFYTRADHRRLCQKCRDTEMDCRLLR